jgi:hypothetical protein
MKEAEPALQSIIVILHGCLHRNAPKERKENGGFIKGK